MSAAESALVPLAPDDTVDTALAKVRATRSRAGWQFAGCKFESWKVAARLPAAYCHLLGSAVLGSVFSGSWFWQECDKREAY